MSGMRQFGKKTPKAKPATANEVAISLSKKFLKPLTQDGLFSGDEKNWTPTLKYKFDNAFKQFVSSNAHIQEATWDLFLEHLCAFSDEAWRLKRTAGTLSWSDATLMLETFNWQDR